MQHKRIMGSTDYQPELTTRDTQLVEERTHILSQDNKRAAVRLRVSECTELTGVVNAVQQFDRASTDHSANVNQETRWKGGQGEEGELLLRENSSVTVSF